MIRGVFLLGLVVLPARSIEAQTRPSLSVDATAGVARVGSDMLFKDQSKFHLAGAAHLVMPGDGARWIAGLVGEAELYENGSCSSPYRNCVRQFPDMTGLTAEGGIRVKTSRVDIDFAAGPGIFGVDQGSAALALSAAARVATRGFSHVGFVASVRGIVLPNSSFGTLWLVPVTAGMRFR